MMLEKRIPALLIMEADATWEYNMRPIMSELNTHFRDMLRTQTDGPLYGSEPAPASGGDDPWMSDHWDVLSIGHCLGSVMPNGPVATYKSPFANEGPLTWKEYTLQGERMIHRAKHMVCTAAYAITLRGAAKLLLRSSFDLNGPIDLIMNSMAEKGELVVYSVVQPPVMQWRWVDGIGMEHRNSDIKPGDAEGEPEPPMDGWEKAREAHSVWTSGDFDGTGGLKESALVKAWGHIYSKEALDQW